MAGAFLNCGNPQLEKAGRKWGIEHGYKIITLNSGEIEEKVADK